jgi:two-component system phosphate regulon sensor histidine kinase PhoR
MSSPSLRARWQQSPFNRIALKMAVLIAVLSGGLVAVVADLPWWSDGFAGLALGGATYGAAHAWLVPRINLALTTLHQIRKHQFDNLEATSVPRGDELNTLIWQVYRTGQKLENEIRELKRMENYRREFIGNVSHELKTPIFSVQGFTETLLDGALEDESVNRSFLEKIMRNVERLDNLARDLSAISRIETGELEMNMAPFDLGALIEEVTESLEMKAEEKNIHLRSQVPNGLPTARGDRERIRQVLVNLVDNAIKYNDADGHVEVVARHRADDEIKVSIVDDGIGVPPEHVARLTERFYRVDKSRSRNQGGTGLGLAIVKHILGAHDRELQVESTPGSGSTFGFTLAAARKKEGA